MPFFPSKLVGCPCTLPYPFLRGEEGISALSDTFLKKLVLSSESNILSICFIGLFWSYCNDRNGIDRVVVNALEYTVSSLPGFCLSSTA